LRSGECELYDLEDDPAEIYDLANKKKEKMAEMIGLWEQYENDAGILLSPDIPRFLQIDCVLESCHCSSHIKFVVIIFSFQVVRFVCVG